jgi:hypothetical protein
LEELAELAELACAMSARATLARRATPKTHAIGSTSSATP